MNDLELEELEQLIESGKREEAKYKNIFEFGAGTYVISIYLPRPLKQLADAEEALKKGYIPYLQPNIWSIGISKFKAEQMQGFSPGNMKRLADLVLDDIDILSLGNSRDVVAYVPSGKDWSDSSVNEHVIIAMQFYKKNKT